MFLSDCSGGDEEMEREEMTQAEVEQFENNSKDEPWDHWCKCVTT